MKYLRLYESFDEVARICREYNIFNYIINSDGSIDVDGNVFFGDNKLVNIPIKFNKVNGNFDCSYNNLSSLDGSPIEVNGTFYCSWNKLTSFQYAPRIIRGAFICSFNNIKTFEYFPSSILRFWAEGNPIWNVWTLFQDWTKIELLNDYDIFRDEDTNKPAIIMDRLNDFLLEIGKDPVKKVKEYKNI